MFQISPLIHTFMHVTKAARQTEILMTLQWNGSDFNLHVTLACTTEHLMQAKAQNSTQSRSKSRKLLG